jgi:nucleoside-diphosphate-sugar epimerase
MKSALVLGAGGFIGAHMVRRLAAEGFHVRGADLVLPAFSASAAHEFLLGDLRDRSFVERAYDRPFTHVYQFAADMGGAGYIFTGENDAQIMRNSALININVIEVAARVSVERLFYASSACVYPEHNQREPDKPKTTEDTAYPANPDSEYGWEKLFSERLYQAAARNQGLDVRIARYHNVFGPEGAWRGGREKVPAALCRKVAETPDGGSIEIWGDGRQTRSFLYIDECVEGTLRLMRSTLASPINIGSQEMVTINELARRIIALSGKTLSLRHVPGPTGVRGRISDNALIARALGWAPSAALDDGLVPTYAWIAGQVEAGRAAQGATSTAAR